MSFTDSEIAAILTAAVIGKHDIPMTVEGAEKVAMFHKHIAFFLDLHLGGGATAPGPDKKPAGAESWSRRR